ncbi:unnamed protein product [Periconia digitata]|uniref:Uncharacterized protein n=1 Tax=Periconia digitata TaxID=1303443 RepID=A0A9W4XLC9_9PLEO|nr:unnamed protein product [Periconia digitata]
MPMHSKYACRVLTALAGYCGEDGGEACACYSATYYVPDQWNSLAAGCAVATSKCAKQSTASEDSWCEVARTAAKNTDYCTRSFASSDGPEVVKFAATTVKEDTPSSQPDAKTTSSPSSTGSETATTTGDDSSRMTPTSRIVIISTPTTQGFPSQTSLGSSGSSASFGSKSVGLLSCILLTIHTLFFV